jgi:hypothetical protein
LIGTLEFGVGARIFGLFFGIFSHRRFATQPPRRRGNQPTLPSFSWGLKASIDEISGRGNDIFLKKIHSFEKIAPGFGL